MLTTAPGADGVIHFTRAVAEESIQRKAVVYDPTGEGITTRSARSSRACAAPIPTPPCIGWRRCFTRARTSGSSRGASSSARRRTWGWPIRRRWSSRWPRSRRRNSSGCPRRGFRWPRPPSTSPPLPRATAPTWPWKKRRRKCARASRCRCRCTLRGTGYQGAKRLGHGADYQYSHDHEDAYVPQAYLPEGRRYYEPSDRGQEKRIGERLAHWRALFEETRTAAAINRAGNRAGSSRTQALRDEQARQQRKTTLPPAAARRPTSQGFAADRRTRRRSGRPPVVSAEKDRGHQRGRTPHAGYAGKPASRPPIATRSAARPTRRGARNNATHFMRVRDRRRPAGKHSVSSATSTVSIRKTRIPLPADATPRPRQCTLTGVTRASRNPRSAVNRPVVPGRRGQKTIPQSTAMHLQWTGAAAVASATAAAQRRQVEPQVELQVGHAKRRMPAGPRADRSEHLRLALEPDVAADRRQPLLHAAFGIRAVDHVPHRAHQPGHAAEHAHGKQRDGRRLAGDGRWNLLATIMPMPQPSAARVTASRPSAG